MCIYKIILFFTNDSLFVFYLTMLGIQKIDRIRICSHQVFAPNNTFQVCALKNTCCWVFAPNSSTFRVLAHTIAATMAKQYDRGAQRSAHWCEQDVL